MSVGTVFVSYVFHRHFIFIRGIGPLRFLFKHWKTVFQFAVFPLIPIEFQCIEEVLEKVITGQVISPFPLCDSDWSQSRALMNPSVACMKDSFSCQGLFSSLLILQLLAVAVCLEVWAAWPAATCCTDYTYTAGPQVVSPFSALHSLLCQNPSSDSVSFCASVSCLFVWPPDTLRGRARSFSNRPPYLSGQQVALTLSRRDWFVFCQPFVLTRKPPSINLIYFTV